MAGGFSLPAEAGRLRSDLPDALWKGQQLILWLDIVKKWMLVLFTEHSNGKIRKCVEQLSFKNGINQGVWTFSARLLGETRRRVLRWFHIPRFWTSSLSFGSLPSYVAQCWRQPCSNLSNLLIPLIITQPLFHSLVIPPETSAAHIERNQRMTCAQDKRKKASGGVKTNWTRFCLKKN